MKKLHLLLLSTAAMFLATAALADNNSNTGSNNIILDGAGNQLVQGGTQNTGVNSGGTVTAHGGTGGTANASTHDTNINTNVNTALGGAGGQGGRGGSAKASSKSTSTSKVGNTTAETGAIAIDASRHDVRQVASAYAPNLTNSFGNDSCLGSASGGVSTGIFGISAGSSTTDENCKRLKNSERADKKGYHKAALFILCKDAEFREGMRYETTDRCPQDDVSADSADARGTYYAESTHTAHAYPSSGRHGWQ